MMPKPPRRTTVRPDSSDAPPAAADRLDEYRRKRDFTATPEPTPGSSHPAPPEGKKTELAFVVKKHDATRMHYDLRLEIAGTMASWAVPKGPSYDPQVKRLAVETEDHPMEYATFEGRIPDGSYGAGDMLVWDRGTYETIPPGNEEAMRAAGNLKLRLFGEKLHGEWHVVRTGRQGDHKKPQWLLFKAKDAFADPSLDIVKERPESLVSGKSATRGPLRHGASSTGKSARDLLLHMGEVAKATLAPIGDPSTYLYEIKFDGYRILAGKAGDDVRLYTRKQNDWTDRFQPIADAVHRLAAREAVIDGEACVVDDAGRPSIEALQRWLGDRGVYAGGRHRSGALRPNHQAVADERPPGQLAFAAFDLLWLDGRDLRPRPIEERRELLEALLRGAPPPLSYSTSLGGDVDAIARAALEAGLEGLVAKKKGSPYPSGPTSSWAKIRFELRQDCAIVGYLPMEGSSAMGSLLLGVYEGGELVYAGRVGTGFDTRQRRDFARRLDAARVTSPPVKDPLVLPGDIWARPEMVCEIGFHGWSRDGLVWHPRFLALRPDKAPEDCVRDVSRDTRDAHRVPFPAAARQEAAAPSPAPRADVPLSNPDKVLYPRDGIAKRDIYAYYTDIAEVMLPHLRGRPIHMQRWPHGIDQAEWFQHATPPKAPAFVRSVPFARSEEKAFQKGEREKNRVIVENVETLQWLANLAALTLHQWPSHAPPSAVTLEAMLTAFDQPDYSVIDLDPGDGTWAELVCVALAVRTLLDAIGLESVVKTSGKRGLHIVVPLAPGYTHAEATGFAEQIARAVAKVLPHLCTVERIKEKRGGRLYVDYGQNGWGRTIVAPYTLRAEGGAPVSCPLLWSEVDEKLDPRALNLRTVRARIDRHGDLFAGALRGTGKIPATRTS